MPDLRSDTKNEAKEVMDVKRDMDRDTFLSDLDNILSEGGLSARAVAEEEENSEDSERSVSEEIEEAQKEEEQDDQDGQEFKPVINGDNMTDASTGATINLSQDLNQVSQNDDAGMQDTGEDKAAGNDMSSESLLDMTTGATAGVRGMRGFIDQQNMDVETGAVKVVSKHKLRLFKMVDFLKKTKKGLGNFFSKKLPAAFKTGATKAKGLLKYTPVAPLVHLIDKVAEHRESTRPQREEKARQKEEAAKQKKAQMLIDKDKKLQQKAEERRLKEEMDALEAKWKAAHKEYEARWNEEHNTTKFKVGKFFKGIWGGIKTGAKKVAQIIKAGGARLAGGIIENGNALASTKVGQNIGKVARKSIVEVKKFIKESKEFAVEVVGKVTNWYEQTRDEYDEYSFENRMTKIDEEERKKKENGEEVPDEDYRTRYLALTEELKGKLAPIRKNVDRRKHIEEALAEMEGSQTLSLPGEEEISTEDWRPPESYTKGADIAGSVISGISQLGQTIRVKDYGLGNAYNYMKQTGKYAAKGLLQMVTELGQMGVNAAKVDVHRKRQELMDAIRSTTADALIRRIATYAKSNAEIQKIEAGIDIAKNIIGAGEGLMTSTGNLGFASALSVLNNVLTGIKMLSTATKKRAQVKNGIKDMLGGKEGYYALKQKYKMHAPEMRRAVRDALGVSTSEEAATADKWELSHQMRERIKSGEDNSDIRHMVRSAGGDREIDFDTLMGAGKTVRRRNADRSKKKTFMTAESLKTMNRRVG